ncbi:MAG: hypothetical protein IID54_02370 [Proteobacteria bacterium]|nr:hypothetical protein [Pseudomonadota bacterium]
MNHEQDIANQAQDEAAVGTDIQAYYDSTVPGATQELRECAAPLRQFLDGNIQDSDCRGVVNPYHRGYGAPRSSVVRRTT